jgi:hypothetical protein
MGLSLGFQSRGFFVREFDRHVHTANLSLPA